MAALNSRYTEEDVRRYPDLAQVAYQYLRLYTGDFPFVVEAKNFLVEYQFVPTATIKGVLNCMRADPRAAMLLPATETGRPDYEPVQVPYYRGFPGRRWADDDRTEISSRQRPAYVDLKTSWNRNYILSTHMLARVAHILRHDRSFIRWRPHVGEYQCYIHAWCSYHSYTGYCDKLLIRLTNDREGRPVCKTCQTNMERFQERNRGAGAMGLQPTNH